MHWHRQSHQAAVVARGERHLDVVRTGGLEQAGVVVSGECTGDAAVPLLHLGAGCVAHVGIGDERSIR